MERVELRVLESSCCGFQYKIDLNNTKQYRNERIQATLLGIECDYEVMAYARACCQAFLHFQGFADHKSVTSGDGGTLHFSIRQKDGIKYLFITAIRSGEIYSKEDYYDYQDVSQLDFALNLCLRHVLDRR